MCVGVKLNGDGNLPVCQPFAHRGVKTHDVEIPYSNPDIAIFSRQAASYCMRLCETMHHSEAMANRKKLKQMKRITVTVDPDDYAAIDRLAQEGDVTASWLIRRSMREFLLRQEREGVVGLPIGLLTRRSTGGA